MDEAHGQVDNPVKPVKGLAKACLANLLERYENHAGMVEIAGIGKFGGMVNGNALRTRREMGFDSPPAA